MQWSSALIVHMRDAHMRVNVIREGLVTDLSNASSVCAKVRGTAYPGHAIADHRHRSCRKLQIKIDTI